MLIKNRITRIGFLVMFLILISRVAFAASAGAYSIETEDAGAFGMGTAFVGEANTPAAVYYNPAGINQMTRPEISVGDAILAPRAQMTQASNGNVVHEENNEYSVPNFYAVIPVIPNKLSIGASSGSNWGLGTNWGPNSPLEFATTQASIKDVDNSFVASYQVTNQWSIAASADNDYSREDVSFSLNNLGFSPTNANAEIRAGDDAWGYRIATMYKINDQNQIGLMYRSRIDHDYTGKIAINNLGPAYQVGFGGPFSGSNFITNIEEKSVLPQSVVIGYSLKPTTKWTINADLKWTDWSSMKYETLSFSNLTPGQAQLFNSLNHIPQNWHSTWTESIGAQYDATNRFRVRAGYYHIESPISGPNFTPEIPDSNSNGITTGFGFDITKRLTLDVTYSGLIYDTRNITNSVANVASGAGNGGLSGTVDGKYSQFVNIGLISLTYKF